MQDSDLIAATLSGDHSAFSLLISRYDRRVRYVISKLVYNPDDAEDVVMVAYERAYAKLPLYQGGSSFYTWLYRLAVRCAYDHLSANRRDILPLTVLEDEEGNELERLDAAEVPDALDILLQEERRREVRRAIRSLPPNIRRCVWNHCILGRDYYQTADIMRIPMGTLKSRLSRAYDRLAVELRDTLRTP